MVSQRCLQVGEEIRRVLASILTEGIFVTPGLEEYIITVTEVRMSPDLKVARVLLTPLSGGSGSRLTTLLNKEKPLLRRELGRRIHLKYTPELIFQLDTRFEQADQVIRLMHTEKVKKDLDKPE